MPEKVPPEKGDSTRRFDAEEKFHDDWAASEDLTALDVRAHNEVCTAPEMRCIRKELGELHGKRLLDVGCGLGEASVYFALEGAEVTSTDISGGMLAKTLELARHNGVSVRTHKSTAEDLLLGKEELFDIIYTGNLLHHVDIATTVAKLARQLKPDGVMVSWDPVAYNPIINIYRRLASKVRTEDEHPFRLADIASYRKHFRRVRTEWFWLTTLVIFIIMALIERRDPNKERYWKKVVEEGPRWAWLYNPLEKLDRLLIGVIPWARLWCWNVVVIAQEPLCRPAETKG